jgi:hypothetical protein
LNIAAIIFTENPSSKLTRKKLKSRLSDLEMPVRSLETDEVSSVSDTSKNHENHVVPKTMKTRLKHAFAKKNPKVTNISPSNPPADMKSFFDDIETVRSSIEQVKDAANKMRLVLMARNISSRSSSSSSSHNQRFYPSFIGCYSSTWKLGNCSVIKSIMCAEAKHNRPPQFLILLTYYPSSFR